MMPIPSSTQHQRRDSGFSLPELLVSLLVLSVIVGTVTQLSMTMSNGQRTMWNRTQMHSSVRGAIALLQQEVGQAGLVALPAPVTLSSAVIAGAQTVTVNSAAGIFIGEKLVIGTGVPLETVVVTDRNLSTNQFSAVFAKAHAAGEAVTVLGGFAQASFPPSMTNGSTASVLKLFGDVNDDGQMVYVDNVRHRHGLAVAHDAVERDQQARADFCKHPAEQCRGQPRGFPVFQLSDGSRHAEYLRHCDCRDAQCSNAGH